MSYGGFFGMPRRIAGALAVVTAMMLTPQPAPAQLAEAPDIQVEELGDNRFRIGEIVVDKSAGSFTVPASLLDLGVPEAPLEFLVATRDGPKSYETLFEIDANAFEFNVACLLIGLNPDNAVMPKGNFEPTPADGDPVGLHLSWEIDGVEMTKPASAFLQVQGDEEPTDEWVYVGSFFLPDGRYAADWIGLAVGFVHDVESIIQHASGIGLVSYGATVARPVDGVTPATPLQLIVSRKEK